RFLFLPDGEDPDSLVRHEGTDAFRARINQHAQPLADYFFQQLSEEADPRSLEGKAHLVTLAAPLIDQIPGNHLRTLMRQRLPEVTRLSGALPPQVAQRPPPATKSAASNAPPTDYGYYFEAQPDYGDVAAYADHIEPPAAVYEQPWQKGKSKDWKK